MWEGLHFGIGGLFHNLGGEGVVVDHSGFFLFLLGQSQWHPAQHVLLVPLPIEVLFMTILVSACDVTEVAP